MLPDAHLPLTPQAFQILLSLADRDLHGYAIILDVRERSGGEVNLTASTLYAALQRMLDAGMIEEVLTHRREGDDPRRRYYSLTRYGRDVARAEARRLERLTDMARRKRLLPGNARGPQARKA
jgi:DNA-binding PadR family transcriptional regulator